MRRFPWPITLLTFVLLVIGALTGVTTLLSASASDPGAVVDGKPLPLLLGQLGARNLTMAGILLAAWIAGGARVLGYVFAMRAATETLDLYFVTSTGALPVPAPVVIVAFLGLFIVPEVLSARYLLREEPVRAPRTAEA